MCFQKIKSFHKRYIDRCRSFYSSSIAGLFTGVIIGIFFSLVTDASFNRWINPFQLGELFAAIIYFGFTLILIYILYFFGKACVYVVCIYFLMTKIVRNSSKKKNCLINFKINYFAGIYSATWVASLIILHTQFMIALYVSIMFILLYFPVEYFVVRNKKG